MDGREGCEKERLSGLYRKALLIRRFEEKVDWLFSRGLLGGTTHLCIGQEAVAVGVASALGRDDYVVSTHRGHGHLLARGADPERVFAELLGYEQGYCRGRGGTQHLCVTDLNFLGTNGITGGGVPIATGAALSIKLKGEKRVSVCFLGDGASNQGVFYESLNMASVWDLPVLYVCENNLYAMSTPFSEVSKLDDVARKADAFGIRSTIINGMDVTEVAESAARALRVVRSGDGPMLIEAKTYRYCGHSKSDARTYRTREEEGEWKLKDPLLDMERRLSGLMDEREITGMKEEAEGLVEGAYERALKGTEPGPGETGEGVYAQGEALVQEGAL